MWVGGARALSRPSLRGVCSDGGGDGGGEEVKASWTGRGKSLQRRDLPHGGREKVGRV